MLSQVASLNLRRFSFKNNVLANSFFQFIQKYVFAGIYRKCDFTSGFLQSTTLFVQKRREKIYALENPGLTTRPGRLQASILTSAALLWRARAQHNARKPKSIDFDVSGLVLEGPWQNKNRNAKSINFDFSGLALEGPGLKIWPGRLKASILTSAALLWRAPGSKHGPES